MNRGYYIEQELTYRVESFTWLHEPISAEPSMLRDGMGHRIIKHPTPKEDTPFHKMDSGRAFATLKKAMVNYLTQAFGDYAQREGQGCKIDHPSQKHHDICLWNGPQEWIGEFNYHLKALECLNVDIIQHRDEELWSSYPGEKRKRDQENCKGLILLSPKAAVEANKIWEFLKQNQKGLTDPLDELLDGSTSGLVYQRWIRDW